MIGIYLSGTGNTKHCIEKLVHSLDETAQIISIEDKAAADLVAKHQKIVLAYPTQFSNAPLMVIDFIRDHAELWSGKRVLCVSTMGLFSGDGAGCSARLLEKYDAKVVGGLHLKMPDSVCDSKLLKKSLERNRAIIKAADRKIEKTVQNIKKGIYPKDGLYFYDRIAGLICQRLWFYGKTNKYADGLRINKNCDGCSLCEKQCPMHNLKIQDNKAVAGQKCTMCYRCISSCPNQAITLLGQKVIEQCRFEKYK